MTKRTKMISGGSLLDSVVRDLWWYWIGFVPRQTHQDVASLAMTTAAETD
jgi:hypothetical protein